MLRSFFLGVGIFLLVLGFEASLVDQATITNLSDEGIGPSIVTVAPQPWVPWTLMSAGAVTILYSYTLPQKFKGGG